jgi:hypothetical protein
VRSTLKIRKPYRFEAKVIERPELIICTSVFSEKDFADCEGNIKFIYMPPTEEIPVAVTIKNGYLVNVQSHGNVCVVASNMEEAISKISRMTDESYRIISFEPVKCVI